MSKPNTRPELDARILWEAARFVRSVEKLMAWSERLELPLNELDFMGACEAGGMLLFPMYDGAGQICGIRTRTKEGEKRAILGSKAGVFLPCLHLDLDREPVICEGPTDATAAMALGFEPIGRPSCRGCEQQVVDTCKRFQYERVTICADADGPGISGAESLAKELQANRISVRMVTPGGHKDLRDWFKTGVTRQVVDAAWSQAEWR